VPLDDDDVREILRIIDESQVDELRIETRGFRLHVLRGAAAAALPEREPPPGDAAAGAAEPAAPDDGSVPVTAPMLGTFYRAEGPGRPPYVEVGSAVTAGTVVCLIEVMKMMNSIEAGVAGTVAEVCASNGELVEYGQPLFRIEPPG
jgi:acetyl-CoA carboxylase biotin carboxyl carrier protein